MLHDLSTAAQQLDHLDVGVLRMAQAILKREGGLVDNPSDSGGITNYGVSLRHARAQGLVFDLNHDGRVDADDIRLVTPEIAELDFLTVFFVDPGINKLPRCLQACAFDHAVNGGPSAAVRLAQQTCNALIGNKPTPHLSTDGVIGPMTVTTALSLVDAVGEQRMLDGYIDQRIAEYHAIAARHPEDAQFLHGWLNRANSFRGSYAATSVPVAHSPVPVPSKPTPAPAMSENDDNVADALNAIELRRIQEQNQ